MDRDDTAAHVSFWALYFFPQEKRVDSCAKCEANARSNAETSINNRNLQRLRFARESSV
jgi:hypothetical protein